MAFWDKLRTTILDVIAPIHCISCGSPDKFICNDCANAIPYADTPCLYCGASFGPGICRRCSQRRHISRIRWRTSYRHPIVQRLIGQYKYRHAWELAPTIATLMTGILDEQSEGFLLLPVPLHRHRERDRGFNQSYEIARALSSRYGWAIAPPNALVRTHRQTPQARLASRTERLHSLRGAFALQNPDPYKAQHVLIIDDVATTGATLAEVARTIRPAGPSAIEALVFAHD